MLRGLFSSIDHLVHKNQARDIPHFDPAHVRALDEHEHEFLDSIPDMKEEDINPNFYFHSLSRLIRKHTKVREEKPKKRALLIGINYVGQTHELSGCYNDVEEMKKYLEKVGFDEFMVMTDEQTGDLYPTKVNICKAFRWLVADAHPHDTFFLHFSGHGGSIKDEDGDESDGYDETLFPVDYLQEGVLIDDDIHMMVVKTLPPGSKLTSVFDCCHSGSLLDLPYTYSSNGKLVTNVDQDKLHIFSSSGKEIFRAFKRGDSSSALLEFKNAMHSLKGMTKEQREAAHKRTIQTRTTLAQVIMFSGCKDYQNAADTEINGKVRGAMSHNLLRLLNEKDDWVLIDLLKELQKNMEFKFAQSPQLSTGYEMDIAPKAAVKGKKVAAAPYAIKSKTTGKVANPLLEKTPRNFGIGQDIQPSRNLSRYVKWPEYVRLQRQKSILKQRLKVPPSIAQFSKALDKNTATLLFKLFDKYRPETKVEKKARLTAAAEAAAAGGKVDQGKKPVTIKYGINHITALVEAKKASLVVIADDVDPIELVVWLPALCRKMGVPYAIVKSKSRLGTLVHKKTATAVALTDVKPEDKQEFAALISAIKVNFNDKFEESRKHWGGGIMGFKSQKKTEKRAKAAAREVKV
ncbi:60S ribosomal protein L8B [Boothiomyces sp. JEL0866]|nr:60S ribosomal protein L8B [Boothiomyces sp. JEL0866]